MKLTLNPERWSAVPVCVPFAQSVALRWKSHLRVTKLDQNSTLAVSHTHYQCSYKYCRGLSSFVFSPFSYIYMYIYTHTSVKVFVDYDTQMLSGQFNLFLNRKSLVQQSG